jgi:hypothetical protein
MNNKIPSTMGLRATAEAGYRAGEQSRVEDLQANAPEA